jgi:hypothetical protein
MSRYIRSIFIEKHSDGYESPRWILWFSILISGLVIWALISMLFGPPTARSGVIGIFILGFQLLGIFGPPFAVGLLIYALWCYFRRRSLSAVAFILLVVLSMVWLAYGAVTWVLFLPHGIFPH